MTELVTMVGCAMLGGALIYLCRCLMTGAFMSVADIGPHADD